MRALMTMSAPSRATRVDHGPDLPRHLLGRDHLLAFHVPAPLREHLVFDVDSGDIHLNQPLGDGRGIQRIAAARIDVRHHRNRHRPHDVPRDIEDIFHIHQADIRHADKAPGNPEAADLCRRKSRAFDDFGAQCVVTPWYHQGFSPLQLGAQNRCLATHRFIHTRFQIALSDCEPERLASHTEEDLAPVHPEQKQPVDQQHGNASQ